MDKYLEEAIAEYEQNMESGAPFYMDAPILMDIEEYYEKNERPYDAERIMRFAEKLHPDSEDVLVVKAYRLKSAGKWRQALDTIRRVPNQECRDVQLFFIEWDVAMARIDKAEKRLDENLRQCLPPDDEDLLFDYGEILVDYGYNERALIYLSKVSKHSSLRKRADELVGDVCSQLGKYEESISAFSRLVDADPYDSVSWTQLAEVQYKARLYADSLESCDYALAIDDTNSRARLFKLYSLCAMKRFDEAFHQYEVYASGGSEDYAMHMLLGEELVSQQCYAEARKPLQEALRLCPLESPDRVRVVSALAVVFIAYGKNKEACELMMTLVSCGSQPTDLYLQLAEIFIDFHNTQEAVEMFNRVMCLPHYSDKDVASIVQSLVKNSIYEPASTLWYFFAKLKIEEDYHFLYAYIVYAMVKMKDRETLSEAFQRAAALCPETLCEVFYSTFYARTVKELRSCLEKESALWEEKKWPFS